MNLPKNDASGLEAHISLLKDVPIFAPALASMHAREWGHLYTSWNHDVALADFRNEKGPPNLPITWVIHKSAAVLMGSVSLVKDDLPNHPTLNPWLASLLVLPGFQGLGLGRVLVQKSLDFLRLHQYRHAFLFTEDKVPFFSKFGFFVHAKTHAKSREITIMKWTNSCPPQEEFTPASQTRTGWDLRPLNLPRANRTSPPA